MTPHLAASLVTVLLAPGPTLTVGEHTFHRRTLRNGLEALAVDDGEGGKVSVFTVYAAGTRAETEATMGLAHLTEHALFTGTASTPSGKHDAVIKAMGGESNAYTRADYTAYYAHRVPRSKLARVLKLEADRMRGLTFGEAAFLHERERLRVEETHSNATDLQLGRRRAYVIWGGRGYGPGLFDAKGNSRGPTLSLAQVRAFYDTWYRPRNAAVVVVGAEPKAALDAIETAFGELPAGPRPPELSTPTLGAGELTLDAPISRPRREWAWVGPALSETSDRLALSLLAELAEGRKTADNAPIETWQGGRVGPDLFVIASTGAQAEAGVEGTWSFLREGSWSDADLNAAKKRMRDAFTRVPLRARPYFSLAVEVATLTAHGHADHAAEHGARVDALTRADLLAAAKRWLTPERRIRITYRPQGKLLPLPDDAAGLRKAAEAAQASGEYARAIQAYERLLTKRPGRINLVIFRYQLGALNRELGDLEKAREHLLAGLKVVEYPALRELLEKVEAEIKTGKAPAAPESQPTSRPASKPATQGSGKTVIGTKGKTPPAWASSGAEVMAQLEGWRGLPFKTDLVVEFLDWERKYGSAGWYEPKTKRLVVTLKGTERFGRGTMLHEMFHALQDQHYDLTKVHELATAPDGDRAVTALIEGEAMLAVQELMNYEFARHAKIPAEGDLDEERYKKVFHYGSGLQFVLAVRKARGWAGVRAAYANPPTSTAEVFHPERYLGGWKPLALSVLPKATVGEGETLVESNAEGEYGVRVFLSRDPATRPQAVELGSALTGDVHHQVKTTDGVRHTWILVFDSRKATERFLAAAKVAATRLPGLRGQGRSAKGDARVTLTWTSSD